MLDLKMELVGLDGKPVVQPDPQKEDETMPLTLGDAILFGLLMSDQQETKAPDKLAKFKLAQKVSSDDDIVFSDVERDLVKTSVGIVYGTLVMGLVYALVDPASME